MSKLVLLDRSVIKTVVSSLLGAPAADEYSLGPTQWPNPTSTDVVYVHTSSAGPAILLEVQHTVDDDYIRRLISYSLSAAEMHHLSPIVLTFVVSSIEDGVKRRLSSDTRQPFLLRYPSEPWARHCYLVTLDSITPALSSVPLSPFVALSMYLIGQEPSLLSNPFREDATMQELYGIAKRIFSDYITQSDKVRDELGSFCGDTKAAMEQLLQLLGEARIDDSATKSRMDGLCRDVLAKADHYHQKYQGTGEPSSSVSPEVQADNESQVE